MGRRKRGYLRRRLAVRSIRGLTRTDRSAVTGVLDEYAGKLSQDELGNPQQLSELEHGLLADMPSWFEETAKARAKLVSSVADLIKARTTYREATARAEGFPTDDTDSYLDAKESAARLVYDAVLQSTKILRELRENVEAELALRRFLAKWLVVAVDVLVFVADFLLFWQTLLRLFDIGWSPSDLIGAAATFLFSFIGPTVAIVSGIVLARLLALKRAQKNAAKFGVTEISPSEDDSTPPPLTPLRWYQRLLRWVRPDVPEEWSGVARWSVILLTAVAVVYTVTFKLRLSLVEGSVSDKFPAQLQILAVLFLILPVIAFVANAAGSNPLADAVEEAEKKLEIARLALQRAQEAIARRAAEIQSRREELAIAQEAAREAWAASWEVLKDTIAETDSFVSERKSVYQESRRRLLALERGLNDRLPLMADPQQADRLADAAMTSLDANSQRVANALLTGPREALETYRPESAEDSEDQQP